jgi:uncharacterized protein YciI
MFIVFLKFSSNRARAPEFMAGHNQWVQQGLDDGVFQLVGSLHAGEGGAILAHGEDRGALQTRVDADPFVEQDVVSAQIIGIDPNRAQESLNFLLPQAAKA